MGLKDRMTDQSKMDRENKKCGDKNVENLVKVLNKGETIKQETRKGDYGFTESRGYRFEIKPKNGGTSAICTLYQDTRKIKTWTVEK